MELPISLGKEKQPRQQETEGGQYAKKWGPQASFQSKEGCTEVAASEPGLKLDVKSDNHI